MCGIAGIWSTRPPDGFADRLAAMGAALRHRGPDAQGVPLHDFSTNANACGPCPPVLEALRAADPTRYPDPRYMALREQLAAFHGVDRERIVVAASASEFIARITAGRRPPVSGTSNPPRENDTGRSAGKDVSPVRTSSSMPG